MGIDSGARGAVQNFPFYFLFLFLFFFFILFRKAEDARRIRMRNKRSDKTKQKRVNAVKDFKKLGN